MNTTIAYAAAVILGLALSELGAETWALFATGVAVLGLLFRWSVAPHFVMMLVAIGLVSVGRFRRASVEGELILTAALLAYMVGHFRRQDAAPTPATMIVLFACIVLPQVTWLMLPPRPASYGLTPWGWRLIVLAWAIALPGLVIAAYVSYRNAESQTPAEAELFLRDEFWAETRSDQRRIHRWTVQARRTSGGEP